MGEMTIARAWRGASESAWMTLVFIRQAWQAV